MDIKNCVALVTGGASGLGEATVRQLVSAGARAVIADVNAERGEALAEELGDGAIFVHTDVSDADKVSA
ncbi:MAG: SDR family NAD(P)-dependent oxidoreductase, partial [Acidobacteriota bacterium]